MAVDFLPTVCPPPTRKTGTAVGHTSSQVTVGFLCGGYQCDDTVQIDIQPCIVFYGQRVRCSFDDFIRVGVVERKVAPVLAFFQSACDGEVVETAVLLTLPEGRGNGHRAVRLDARRPERVLDTYLGERHFHDLCRVLPVDGNEKSSGAESPCGSFQE